MISSAKVVPSVIRPAFHSDGNTHGTCQLGCGEIATRRVYGVAVGDRCVDRIRRIASDAGVDFDEVSAAHAPREFTNTGTGEVFGRTVRVCDSCGGNLPTRKGPIPRNCPLCGSRTRPERISRARGDTR